MYRLFWLVSFALLFACVSLAQNQFVYTNNNNSPAVNGSPNSVSAFVVTDGVLTELPDSPFLTAGNGSNGGRISAEDIVVVPRPAARTSLLYAINQGDSTVAGFRLHPQRGRLVAVDGSPFRIAPKGNTNAPKLSNSYSMDASPDGRFLFIAGSALYTIHVFSIDRSGALTEVSGSPFATDNPLWGLKVTADGQYLIAGQASKANVEVFGIAPDGSLSQISGSPFSASGPSTGVTANCADTLAFHVNYDNNSVDVYDMAPDGTLTAAAGSPYQTTTGFDEGMELTPDGRVLYVTNAFSSEANNNGAISAFAVGGDGVLSSVPGSPFLLNNGLTGGVAATTASADGKYLFSYYFVYAQVDVEAIGEDGGLTSMGSYSTGFPGAGSGMGIVSYPAPTCGSK